MPSRSPFTQLCQQMAQLRAESRRADLHIHTHHSDGMFSPEEVVRRARQRGLGAIAITDHDTTAGCAAGRADGLEVIPGVEITCDYRGRELHLLGYFFRPDDLALTAALAELQAHRRQRFTEMIERLPANVRPDAANIAESPGRRSLAQMLVERGAVKTVGEAFSRYLHDGGPACVPKRRLPVAEAIALVRAAGGTTSWAHPPPDVSAEHVSALREMGLAALEAVYPTFTAARSRRMRELARVFGLAVTGGSDCHGPSLASRAIGTWGITSTELNMLRGSSTACGVARNSASGG
ncbi:MAG: PHP domain-containing protein [Gemmataceae bacterium]